MVDRDFLDQLAAQIFVKSIPSTGSSGIIETHLREAAEYAYMAAEVFMQKYKEVDNARNHR